MAAVCVYVCVCMLDFAVQFHRDTSNPHARNGKIKSSIRGKYTWLNAGLILGRLHAILRLRQIAFGLDRVQWKSPPSARLVNERANQRAE